MNIKTIVLSTIAIAIATSFASIAFADPSHRNDVDIKFEDKGSSDRKDRNPPPTNARTADPSDNQSVLGGSIKGSKYAPRNASSLGIEISVIGVDRPTAIALN